MKISVVTAVYNGVKTVGDALDSVASQDYSDVDHVVIDGASKDGTTELIECRKSSLGTFISERDAGIYDALNKGIRHAQGEVVGFLHADDLYADKGVLSRIAQAFSDPNVGVVYGDLVYVKKEDPSRVVRYWRSGEFARRKLAVGWMPPHPTLYVRRRIYEQLGLFNTSYRISADYENILRLLSNPQVNASYIPQVLVKMRLGGASNRSIRNMIVKSKEDYRALRSTGTGGALALAVKNISKLPQFFSSTTGVK